MVASPSGLFFDILTKVFFMSTNDNDHIDEMNGDNVNINEMSGDEYHLDIQKELDDDRVNLDDPDVEDDENESDDESDEGKGEDSSVAENAKGKPKNIVFFAAVALVFGVGGFVLFGNLNGSDKPNVPVVAAYSDADDSAAVDDGDSSESGSVDAPLPVADHEPTHSINSPLGQAQSSSLSDSAALLNASQNSSVLAGQVFQQSSSSLVSQVDSAVVQQVVSHSSEKSDPVKAVAYIDKPLVQDSRVAPGVAVGSIYSTVTSKGEDVANASSFASSSSAINGDLRVVEESPAFAKSVVLANTENSVEVTQQETSADSQDMVAVLNSIKAELENIKREQKAVHELVVKNKVLDSKSGEKTATLQKSSSSSSLSPRERLVLGRSRLPGFQVVQPSSDQKMSIVRVAKQTGDNIIVLYQGESFRSSQAGLVKVKSILENGSLIFVGDKWFIDDLMEKAKVVNKPKASKASSSRSSSSVASQSSSSSMPGMIISTQRPTVPSHQYGSQQSASATASAVNASGWSLNVVYNDVYIVTSPSGDPIQVKKGESLKGLGVVMGINGSGDLMVGNYLISTP